MPEDALFMGMVWRFEQVHLKNSIDIKFVSIGIVNSSSLLTVDS